MFIVLVIGSGIAGWVDAVIGGGGLILIPLVMAAFPTQPPVVALATNKLAAMTGTSSAAIALARKVPFHKKLAVAMVPLAIVGAMCGAHVASSVPSHVMRPIVIVLMLCVGVFVAFRPSFGTGHEGAEPSCLRRVIAVLLACAVAFYDGVFGPGTGLFLLVIFSEVLQQSFIRSAVLVKIINTSTNIGGLIIFISGGYVWWSIAIVLAVANVIGAQLGARTVLVGGNKLLRIALLIVVVVMAVYLSYQQITLSA